MKKYYLTVVIALTVLLTGCVSELNRRNAERYALAGAINQRNAVQYAQNGEQTKARDSWDTARRAYARAVVNGELAGLPAKTQALLMYEYGRSLGVTCFFDLAETWLNNAYEQDKQADQPLYLSLDELGRLMFDQRKYPQATEYLGRGIKLLDEADFYKSSPGAAIAYADILDEYALALSKSGNDAKVSDIKKRAAEIRSQYPNQISSTDRTPYGKYCTNQQ
jgi:hypothetical protein